MHRRIAFVTAVCALALPASAFASEPAATGAGGVGVEPSSMLEVTSLKASKSGRTVTARVRWDRGLINQRAARERFTVRLLSGSPGQRRLLASSTRKVPKGKSETIRLRLNARNARRVKASSRVFATATQQFDGRDRDKLYELNHVAIASMKGKRPFASAAAGSCPTVIKPNTDMTGCQLPGVNLSGANLLGVIFYKANLEVSNLTGANLRTTNLTQADLTGANLAGATMSDGEQASLTFPGDGNQIGQLIDSAKTSVDVIIYEIGGPNIVGQPSQPGSLMKAVQRGVNVRVIVNSGNKQCVSLSPDDQLNCLSQPGADAYYAVEAALKSAADAARAKGKTPGSYRVQFSSQNYQITHQKTILIDTSDDKGNPLTQEQLAGVPTAQVLVSTGNLQSYGWGSEQYWNKTSKKFVKTNPDYLSDPADSCSDPVTRKKTSCATEWAARDFAIKVTRPDLMERIAAVFAADQACKKWDEASVYQELLGSKLPDTWANGTLAANGSSAPTSYPAAGTPAFYAGFGPNQLLEADPAKPGQVKPQGNSRQRQLDLIASATKTLVVYNEEMGDADMVSALADAARRGVDVRVVMSSTFDKPNGVPTPKDEADYGTDKGLYMFSYLVSNGVKVKFFCSKNCAENELYIHAKAIVADGLNAFMGSENFGYASLNYNRELGLMLTNSTDPDVKQTAPSVVSVGGVAAIMTAFSKDWNDPDAVTFQALQPPAGEPYDGYPKGEYPQPPQGQPFKFTSGKYAGQYEFNLSCVPPGGQGLYSPALPARLDPPPPPPDAS